MKKNNIYQWLCASVIVMTSLFLWSACGEDDTYGKPDVDNTPHLTVKDINPKVTKPGNMVVISGRDMNLVKAVRFGETDQFVVLREAFDKVSTNSTQLVLTIPEDAPIGTVYVISNEDIALEAGTLTAMMPVVEKIEPVSALLPGDYITIIGSGFDLVKGVKMGEQTIANPSISETEIVFEVPNLPEGEYEVNLLYFAGMVKAGDVAVRALVSVDPIQDPEYVYFDFNNTGAKDSWWGYVDYNNQTSGIQKGTENDPDLSLDGTAYARITTANKDGFFFRNGANNMKTDDVTVDGWVVKMDVNVLSNESFYIRLELQGKDTGTQYMAKTPAMENKGGWYTVTIPLTTFVDNWGDGTNVISSIVGNIDEFGGLGAGSDDTIDVCIDNIRFERK